MAKKEARTPKPAPCGTCRHEYIEREYGYEVFRDCVIGIWRPKYGECKKYEKQASWNETVAAMFANMRGFTAEESKANYDAFLAQSTVIKKIYEF